MVDPVLVQALSFDTSLVDSLRAYTGGSETISYYIHTTGTPEEVNGYGPVETNPINAADQQFIDSLFVWLDARIDLDFVRQSDYNGTVIDLYSLPAIPGAEGDVIGLTSILDGWYDVQWLKTDPLVPASVAQRLTMVHEVGHALGLPHPNDWPDDPRYDTADTVMSYNDNLDVEPWFSDSDLAALTGFWGVEDDDATAPAVATAGEQLVGTRRRDRLVGTALGDSFIAKAGNDRIITGGASSDAPDLVSTGSGRDRVLLAAAGYAEIQDFRVGRDALWVDTTDVEALELSSDGLDALVRLGDVAVARVLGAADQLVIAGSGWIL